MLGAAIDLRRSASVIVTDVQKAQRGLMYLEEWQALSARARGLAEAAQLHSQFLQANNQDSLGVSKELGASAAEIAQDLGVFASRHAAALPLEAYRRINHFCSTRSAIFQSAPSDARGARAAVIFLLNLVADIDFRLHDHQAVLRSRVERAFLHLQRLLATDTEQQKRWAAAFDGKGEVACENLGGTHLLWHGIYAFKVNAAGARTDLVFNIPPPQSSLELAVDGLVLTEWKVADPTEGAKKFSAAKKQADLYAIGAMSALELSSHRYLLVVSKHSLPSDQVPQDIRSGSVRYRHINLVIEPETPSKAALKAKA